MFGGSLDAVSGLVEQAVGPDRRLGVSIDNRRDGFQFSPAEELAPAVAGREPERPRDEAVVDADVDQRHGVRQVALVATDHGEDSNVCDGDERPVDVVRGDLLVPVVPRYMNSLALVVQNVRQLFSVNTLCFEWRVVQKFPIQQSTDRSR